MGETHSGRFLKPRRGFPNLFGVKKAEIILRHHDFSQLEPRLRCFTLNLQFLDISMKKGHIVILILVAISVGAILAMTGDYTTYANFVEAKRKEGKAVNVVGYLAKGKEMVYNPEKDPNMFSFTMVDKEGNEQKVIYRGSKPQDFERSEQLVVKGRCKGDVFAASEISMKCPSKYINDEISLKETTVSVKAGS
jgi:cytochrome c-type biogenesis protein CcmE